MRLTDCFIELIAYVAYFRANAAARQSSYELVRGDIVRLLAASDQKMDAGGFGPDDFDLARFAVVAWIDETILSSNWSEKGKWQSEQLQREFYRTTEAGELFFERLNEVGLHQRDVREVYYLCLAMGFRGRYCHDGDDVLLDQLKTSNLKLLTGSSVGVPSFGSEALFPEAYPQENEAPTPGGRIRRFAPFTLACIAFPAVLFAGLYLLYTFILNHVADNLLN